MSVDGTWLVSTNTVCTLLELFYQAAGRSGIPAGVPRARHARRPPRVAGSPARPPRQGADPAPGPASTADPPRSTTAATTGPASGRRRRLGRSTGHNRVVALEHPGPHDTLVIPWSRPARAPWPSPALGDVAQWLAVVGGALMILGFVLLVDGGHARAGSCTGWRSSARPGDAGRVRRIGASARRPGILGDAFGTAVGLGTSGRR